MVTTSCPTARFGEPAPTKQLKLTTDADIIIGDLKVPKGSYALFTIPNKGNWTLIINKTADQSGASSTTRRKTSATGAERERSEVAGRAIHYHSEENSDKQATLTLEWEKTEASTTIKLAQ